MVGPARVRDGYGGDGKIALPASEWLRPRGSPNHVSEGTKPRSEDWPHLFIALHVDSTNLARAVVEIEVTGELLVFGFDLELRRRLRLGSRARRRRTTAEAWVWPQSFCEVLRHISA